MKRVIFFGGLAVIITVLQQFGILSGGTSTPDLGDDNVVEVRSDDAAIAEARTARGFICRSSWKWPTAILPVGRT